MRTLLVAAVAACILSVPGSSLADHHGAKRSPLDPVEDTVVGIAALAATAVYSPVKIASSIALMTAGLPLALLGWIDVHCLTQGDYVVTSEHLKGMRSLHVTRCDFAERQKEKS